VITGFVALFLTGFVSLIGQIVLLRELNVAFFGVELIYLIALGVWLLLTALGTIAGRRRDSPSPGRTLVLFLLFSLCLPLGVVILRGSRTALGGVPGAYLPILRQMAALVTALAPVALLSGVLFKNAAGLYAVKKRTLAGAYGIESAGALTGGILAALCLRWGIPNFSLAVACALIAAGTVLLFFPGKEKPRLRLAAPGALVLLTLLLWQAAPIDRAMTAWNHSGLLETRDSPYARITITALAGQISVFENGALSFETEGTEAELLAHLAALQHPDPRRILLLGGGIDGTIRELLKHHPARIDWVELDPVLIAMTRRHLPEVIRASLDHPSVHLIAADPRGILQEGGERYDLILIGTPEPTSGQANRFYTREFFRECAGRLAPDGIVALRLPTPENLWTPHLIRRTASIRHALAAVFPNLQALPGTTTVITASPAPLPRSPEILSGRLREREIQTRLVSAPYIRYLFTNDRYRDLEKQLKETGVPMNTDIRPVCYPYAAVIWLSRFFPKLAVADLPGFGADWWGLRYARWAIAAGITLLFLAGRLFPGVRRWLLVAAAGFIGIVFEAVLLLAYQSKEGALYQDIGLLLMAFMAGLALGAWLLNEGVRWTGLRRQRTRLWGSALCAGFCLLGAAVIGSVRGMVPGGLVPTALLIAGAGFLVAGVLAYAGLYRVRDQQSVIAPLYAADLLGGCLGSLLGSLVLIPLLGLDGAVLGMILLAALSALLI
jgi:spermidine synthase